MFKTGKLVGIALVVLVMSGCASAGANETARVAAPVEVAASETPAPVLTADPAPVNDQLVTAVRRIPGLENVELAAAEAMAEQVCSELDAGTSPLDIVAVDGDSDTNNNDAIRLAAELVCPAQHDAVYQTFADDYAINPPKS